MNFVDAVTISGTRKREDGALIVDARTARTGIQYYLGSEVGKPDMPKVAVFRGASEVFAVDSLKTYAHRPITDDHPKEPVTADNWKLLAVGQTADEVTAQDIFIRVPLMISDAAMISKVEAGKRQLSVGYACDLDWTAGITKDGVPFDAQQKNIRVNHIAIVDSGRAGDKVRIGDFATPITIEDEKGNPEMTLKTMIVDGFPIADVSVAAEIVINRILADKAKLISDHAAALATSTAAVTAKDTEIGTLKADLQKFKDAATTPAMLDKMVADRVGLVSIARAIVADVKVDGLGDADIRKAVVVAKYGADFVKDASPDMISGMFAALAKDVKPGAAGTVDTFRQAFVAAGTPPAQMADHGQQKFEDYLQNAWRNPEDMPKAN